MPPISDPTKYAAGYNRIFCPVISTTENLAVNAIYTNPLFRVESLLNLDVDAATELALAQSEGPTIRDFDKFVRAHHSPQSLIGAKLASILTTPRSEFDIKSERFLDNVDYLIQLKERIDIAKAFEDLIDLLVSIVDSFLADLQPRHADDICGDVARGLLAATAKLHSTGDLHTLEVAMARFEIHIIRWLSLHLPLPLLSSHVADYLRVITSSVGLCVLFLRYRARLSQAMIIRFVLFFRRCGSGLWSQLPADVRLAYSMIGLQGLHLYYDYSEPFGPKPGFSANVLLSLRGALVDAIRLLLVEQASMYIPVIRHFVDRINAGLQVTHMAFNIELNTFSEADQADILRLSQTFRQYRTPVSVETLVSFLAQFKKPILIDGMLALLRHVRFLALWQIQELLEKAFQHVADTDGERTVVPLGGIGGSTSMMHYLVAHWRCGAVKTVNSIESALHNSDPKAPLYLLDDCLLSGTQVTDILGDYIGSRIPKAHNTVHAAPLAEKELLTNRPIRFVYAVATDHGVQKLKSWLENHNFTDTQIVFGDLELVDHKPFSPSMNHIWSSAGVRNELETFLRSVGSAILARRAKKKKWPQGRLTDSALGFQDFQRLLIFEYNTPKATISALWEEGDYDGRKWNPLFPVSGDT